MYDGQLATPGYRPHPASEPAPGRAPPPMELGLFILLPGQGADPCYPSSPDPAPSLGPAVSMEGGGSPTFPAGPRGIQSRTVGYWEIPWTGWEKLTAPQWPSPHLPQEMLFSTGQTCPCSQPAFSSAPPPERTGTAPRPSSCPRTSTRAPFYFVPSGYSPSPPPLPSLGDFQLQVPKTAGAGGQPLAQGERLTPMAGLGGTAIGGLVIPSAAVWLRSLFEPGDSFYAESKSIGTRRRTDPIFAPHTSWPQPHTAQRRPHSYSIG